MRLLIPFLFVLALIGCEHTEDCPDCPECPDIECPECEYPELECDDNNNCKVCFKVNLA